MLTLSLINLYDEELANLWKYIDKKEKSLFRNKEEYNKIINAELKSGPILHPFFYEESFDIEDNDAEVKMQFNLYKIL